MSNTNGLGKLISLDEMRSLHEVIDALIPAPSSDEDNEKDLPVNAPPQVTDAMFPGLLGEITEACCKDTEAVPTSVGAYLLVWFTSHIGRTRYMMIGDEQRWLNNFFLLVGPSGSGKGTSGKGPARIFYQVQDKMQVLFQSAFDAGRGEGLKQCPNLQVHNGGLSSGEGLGFALDDGTDSPIPGRTITDKRLLVIESEMANTLCNMTRQGNTLSAQLRNVYDGVDIKPMTKRDRVSVSDPYICLLGNITPDELLKFDEDRLQSFNGLLNRMLMLWTQPQKLVSRPKTMDSNTLSGFSSTIAEHIMKARNGRFETHWKKLRLQTEPLLFTKSAEDLWDRSYSRLVNQPYSKRIEPLVRRHRLHARLMAAALALFQGHEVVTREDMEGALDWIEFSRQSIVFCYRTQTEQRKVEAIHVMAKKVLYAIHVLCQKNNTCTRTDIHNLCQRKLRREQLTEALELLINQVPPLIQQKLKRLESGRSVPVYLPTADAKCLISRECV
ncbi:YfjI family protein [Endozoicomonas gorgoniicola]|uniref:YfjI family protein n=1 Tax=Endozoicomonas gorgoniicola TaxID=1234144 RepID=A0ABT3MRW0_9GAMM|nr:YfjI family protein [Endozoicomonas gorgoniicola]MCW7552111.1 YfjI family protein [Endozoicomonas gorgoniicola]